MCACTDRCSVSWAGTPADADAAALSGGRATPIPVPSCGGRKQRQSGQRAGSRRRPLNRSHSPSTRSALAKASRRGSSAYRARRSTLACGADQFARRMPTESRHSPGSSWLSPPTRNDHIIIASRPVLLQRETIACSTSYAPTGAMKRGCLLSCHAGGPRPPKGRPRSRACPPGRDTTETLPTSCPALPKSDACRERSHFRTNPAHIDKLMHPPRLAIPEHSSDPNPDSIL